MHILNFVRKGIILAGGSGTRLYPITKSVSKQLLPVYNKPMIYYPLTTLMLAGIKDILIITTPKDKDLFEELFGNGKQFGVNISFAIQKKPEGLAQAFIIGEDFIQEDNVTLILGDNLFYGNDLTSYLEKAYKQKEGATLFGYQVNDPERYGVIEFSSNNQVINIVEKPENPKSNYAVTGIYFYDHKVIEYAKSLEKSSRGEYEITDLNKIYLEKDLLKAEILGRGSAWFDTGTHDSLLEASNFISSLEKRQSLKIGSPEEVAWRKGWISNSELENLSKSLSKNNYGKYLYKLSKMN